MALQPEAIGAVMEVTKRLKPSRDCRMPFGDRRGEILGVFGLVGSGIDELSKTLFGALKPRAGDIRLHGRSKSLRGSRAALREGIFLVPGDRRAEGLILARDVVFNATLASLSGASRKGGLLKFRANRARLANLAEQLELTPPDVGRTASAFSGGNQQKIVVAKGLFSKAEVYIFVEPTVGVDVGAQSKIYHLIRELSRDAAVIVMSSDCDEVFGLSDTLAAMYRVPCRLRRRAVLHATSCLGAAFWGRGVTPSKLSSTAARLVTLAIMMAVISAIFQVLAPTYLSNPNVHAILRHMAVSDVVGVGLTFVFVVRRFDLALSGVATLGAMTLGFIIAKTDSLIRGVLGCVAIGAACGLINGVMIGLAKLPEVVTTIAIGSIAYGTSYFYNGGQSYSDNFFSSGILDINNFRLLGIDAPILIFLLTAGIAAVVLHMTRYGQAFRATGENEKTARLSGIPVENMIAAAFVICGALVCKQWPSE